MASTLTRQLTTAIAFSCTSARQRPSSSATSRAWTNIEACRANHRRIVDRISSVVAEQFSPGPDYFLRVRGDSMDRTGLRDGDLVAIRATPEASNGDVVVARFGDEVTLKRFVREG